MSQNRAKTFLFGALTGLVAALVTWVVISQRAAKRLDNQDAPDTLTSVVPPALEDMEKYESPMWSIVAILTLPLSLSLMLEISRRFLNPGPDFIAFFVTVLQGLLTATTVAALSKPGKRLVAGALSRVGIKWSRQQMWIGLFSITWVMVLLLVFRYCLPAIAQQYNDHGLRLLQMRQVSSALIDFRRAVSLNPDLAEAHYNLAFAYEELLALDKAIAEYVAALERNAGLVPAYNNLARLYIRQKKDYDSAIYFLRGTEQEARDDMVRFVIYKNLGWAHYEKGLYHKAAEDLQTSLDLQHGLEAQNPAEALKLTETYRLLALVYEKLDQQAEAIRAWEHSLGYADLRDPFEAEWAEEAQSHLEKLRRESR